jgi:hypothetical protein
MGHGDGTEAVGIEKATGILVSGDAWDGVDSGVYFFTDRTSGADRRNQTIVAPFCGLTFVLFSCRRYFHFLK